MLVSVLNLSRLQTVFMRARTSVCACVYTLKVRDCRSDSLWLSTLSHCDAVAFRVSITLEQSPSTRGSPSLQSICEVGIISPQEEQVTFHERLAGTCSSSVCDVVTQMCD